MIRAARRAPALRRRLLRAVTCPASSLRCAAVRWSAVGPGGRRARQECRAERGGHRARRRVRRPLRCAAFPQARPPKGAPALRCARQGAGPASTAARTRPSLRFGPRGGSACPLALLALRLRSRSLPAARSAWPGARERPRGSASLAQPRGHRPTRPAGTPARTPPASLRREGCAPAVADRSGPALLCPRRKLRALAVAAPRDARCGPPEAGKPRLAPFAALRSRTARPALRSGLWRAASPGARTHRRAGARLNPPSRSAHRRRSESRAACRAADP